MQLNTLLFGLSSSATFGAIEAIQKDVQKQPNKKAYVCPSCKIWGRRLNKESFGHVEKTPKSYLHLSMTSNFCTTNMHGTCISAFIHLSTWPQLHPIVTKQTILLQPITKWMSTPYKNTCLWCPNFNYLTKNLCRHDTHRNNKIHLFPEFTVFKVYITMRMFVANI